MLLLSTRKHTVIVSVISLVVLIAAFQRSGIPTKAQNAEPSLLGRFASPVDASAGRTPQVSDDGLPVPAATQVTGERTAILAPSAVFTVTKTADTNDGVCGADCSLREAIAAANASGGADTINVPAGTYTLTIANTGANEDGNLRGDLDILDSVTIQGAGAATTIIQAGTTNSNGIDKVFALNPICTSAVSVTIDGVTIRNGRNTQPSGAADFSFTGGGVDWCGFGAGNFTLSNSVITANTNVNGYGGGLNIDAASGYTGTVNISNVTFSNNQTNGATGGTSTGGAINIFESRTVTISNSTFTSNQTLPSTSGGGAIYYRPTQAGSLSVSGSTFSSNTAGGIGGAIATATFAAGTTVSITNSTFNGNVATNSFGGAMDLNSTTATTTPFALSHLIITGNTAGISGGGIFVGSSNVNLSKSVIVGNSAPTGSGVHKSVDVATATVTNNWWGCSTGPSAGTCDRVTTAGGTITFTPWYRNQLTAATSPLVVNQATSLTSSFLTNSAGTAVPLADISEIIGRSVIWAASGGNLSSTQATVQAAGTATGSFQASAVGTAVISAKVDNDNTAPVSSNVVSVTVNKAATTAAVTNAAILASTPSVTGQPVSVTYSVTGAFGNSPTVPTGNVTVSDGTDSCTATVAAGTCSVTFRTVGAKTLTATYAGDTNFTASPASASASHTVNKSGTTTTITSDTPDPSVTGQSVTFNVTVAAVSPGAVVAPTTITGTVAVSDGGTNTCNATLTAGTGSCNITFTSAGSYSMTGTYGSDTNFSGSSSVVNSHTVNKAATTTSVTSSQDPTVTGQSVTFTGTVAVTAPGVGTPTGTVDFLDGAAVISGCSGVALTGLTAQCVTSSLSTATHTITAKYNGDSNFSTGTGTLAGGQVVSNTAVWDGSASSDWNTPANWATNFVPLAANDVSIPTAGVTNQAAIPSGTLTVNSLTVASGRTLTLSGGSLTVNGVLTMNGGDITVSGADLLTIGSGGTITRTTGIIIGNIKKTFGGAGAFTYPVGTAGAYSPVDVTVTAGSGDLTVKANTGTAPAVPALPAGTTLQRFWTLAGSGITANVTWHYLQTDVAGSEANYKTIRVTGGTPVTLPNGAPCPGVGSPCVDATANTIFISGISSFSDWTAGELAPTAANVGVSGSVLNRSGRGVAFARVEMVDESGNVVYAITNPFGYYRFPSVAAGQTYVVSVSDKRYALQTRLVSVTDDLTGLDFIMQ